MSNPPHWRKPALYQNLKTPSVALVILLLAGLLTVAGAAHPSAATTATHRSKVQSVTVQVLPTIRQPGTVPAPRRKAQTVVRVTVEPAVAGRRILLERRTGALWKSAGSGTTNRAGTVDFFVKADPPGRTSQFRASASAYRGLTSQRSADPVTDRWGRPDFVDEFNGNSLGPAWKHRIQYYNPWGGRSCSKADPSAVAVAGGTLRVSSMIDPAATALCTPTDAEGNPTGGQYPYRLNANISTQHSADFLYGVAAARMRFPKSMGQHAAFWLQPRGLLETGPTPWGAEIDVIEWFGHAGKRARMTSSVHEPLPNGDKRQIGGPIRRPDRFLASRSDRWWNSFHIFSVEWTPSETIFRISGHEVWRTSQGVSHHPQFLILSMLSSDYELPLAGTDPAPRTAEVDWVAFWQA